MPNKAVNSIMTSVTILYMVDIQVWFIILLNSIHCIYTIPNTHLPRSSSLGTGRFCRGCETCDHSCGIDNQQFQVRASPSVVPVQLPQPWLLLLQLQLREDPSCGIPSWR